MYFQELMSLASDKGFIMSRINARELSNKLSDTIDNDIIFPMLKVQLHLTMNSRTGAQTCIFYFTFFALFSSRSRNLNSTLGLEENVLL